MAFGPESTNPRERRAYAHLKLQQLAEDYSSTAVDEAFLAVSTASNTAKGRASGFIERLGKVANAVPVGHSDQDSGPRLWVPYTSHRTDGGDRRDGYITDGYTHESLDIAALRDTCCVSAEEGLQADEMWKDGSIFVSERIDRHGVRTIVLPEPGLRDDVVAEAFQRYAAA